jgi:hypothetical protein
MKTFSQRLLKYAMATIGGTISLLLYSQSNADGTMPQYYFTNFSDATLIMKSGKMQNQIINYNILTGLMVFQKGDKFYDITNPETIDTVLIQNCKFVPVGKYFYEVVHKGKMYSYYIQHTGHLTEPGKPVGYGGTSKIASTSYVSTANLGGMQWNIALPKDFEVIPSSVYWIKAGNSWFDFETEKQLLKLFPDKISQMKEFIKANKVKIDKPESMVKLIEYLNTL